MASQPRVHKRTGTQQGMERGAEGRGRDGLCLPRAQAGPILLQELLGLLSPWGSQEPMLRPQGGSILAVPGFLAQGHGQQLQQGRHLVPQRPLPKPERPKPPELMGTP